MQFLKRGGQVARLDASADRMNLIIANHVDAVPKAIAKPMEVDARARDREACP